MEFCDICRIRTLLCFIILVASNLGVTTSEKSQTGYGMKRSETNKDQTIKISGLVNYHDSRLISNNKEDKNTVERDKTNKVDLNGEGKIGRSSSAASRRYHAAGVTGGGQMKKGLLQMLKHHKTVDQNSVKRHHLEDDDNLGHLDERPIQGRCDINEQCKADQYCEGTYCYKCRKDKEHCFASGQCCKGAECQYGYCAQGISAGMPGTYCDKAKDCKGDSCCILEISVDHHNAICKPMLEEHEVCGPINLFHQIMEWRAHNEPICGPCKNGLACKSIGIHGHHSVCLPEGSD